MRWNQLADDLPRAKALSNILCGAAMADGVFEDEERVIVHAMLLKVLGASELPAEVAAHLAAFSAETFDISSDIEILAPETARDRKAILKVTADIVTADRQMEPAERVYLHKMADALGLDFADAF